MIMVNVVFEVKKEHFGMEETDWLKAAKSYTFAAYEELKAGDIVVVDTRNGFALGTVKGDTSVIPEGFRKGDIKQVVCKVDAAPYFNRKANTEKRKKIKEEMNQRLAVLQESAIYEMMAEKDPELKAMLTAFNQLSDE